MFFLAASFSCIAAASNSLLYSSIFAFNSASSFVAMMGKGGILVCGLLVVYISTTSHAMINPYHIPGMDRTELIGLITTFLTMFAGSLLLSPQIVGLTNDAGSSRGIVTGDRKTEQEALSVFIVAINIAYLVYVVYFLYTCLKGDVALLVTTIRKYRRGSFKNMSDARSYFRAHKSSTSSPREKQVEMSKNAPPVNLRLSASRGGSLEIPRARNHRSSAEADFIVDNPMTTVP